LFEAVAQVAIAHLESLVLQDTLDGGVFPAWRKLCVEDNTKRAVSDNLALRVCEVSSFAGETILDSFADDFYSTTRQQRRSRMQIENHVNVPPILRLLNAVGRFCDITRQQQI
jgi:hypothetical protein